MLRKYFTRRCIALHLLVVTLVPAFLWLGDWQYHAAVSGNELSWVYTFEWPAFAVYAIYVWWQLIHDQPTGLERLRAAKERAAAAASGVPVEEVPGWALDKSLSKALTAASVEPSRRMLERRVRRHAIEARSYDGRDLTDGRSELLNGADDRSSTLRTISGSAAMTSGEDRSEVDGGVVDALVVDVKVEVDEELDAYNRYLADLDVNAPPKRW